MYGGGTAILLVAALFRISFLQQIPLALSYDEILNGDIISLIMEGKHRLFFREGWGHEPLYHYWAALWRPIVGDNWLALRLPSVYAGLVLTATVMRWGRREFGSVAGLVAGVGVAISWWPVVFSRLGLRPILEPLFLTGTAYWRQKRPVAAGVCLALAVYSYTAARRAAWLLPIGWAVYLLGRMIWRQSWSWSEIQRQLRAPAVILATALVLYLPLGMVLYADPSLQERVGQLQGPLTALAAGDWSPIIETVTATAGVFSFTGDPRWSYGVAGRPLFDPLTSLLFYGGLMAAAWYSRVESRYGYLLLWLGVSLLPSAVTPDAPSTIRMIGGIPAVYMLLGVAAAQIEQRRQSRWEFVLLLLLGVIIGLNGVRTVQTGTEWSRNPVVLAEKQPLIWRSIAEDWAFSGQPPLVVSDNWYAPIKGDALDRNLGEPVPARWVQAGRALVLPQAGNGRLYEPEFAPLAVELKQAVGLTEPLYRGGGGNPFCCVSVADRGGGGAARDPDSV